MKTLKWYLTLAAILLVFSVITYTAQIMIFEKPGLTFFYMFQDFAFLSIDVLIVALILEKLLKRREKQALLNKLNMVIGVFYNDMGNELIRLFVKCTKDFKEFEGNLNISTNWKSTDFVNSAKNLTITAKSVEIDPENLSDIKQLLCEKREALLKLLANPNLLEHETFTDLLWAVFHLCDELYYRGDLAVLPDSDMDHLRGDLVRAYRLVLAEWILYMQHLNNNYPYLYSVAVRTNPFLPENRIIVT